MSITTENRTGRQEAPDLDEWKDNFNPDDWTLDVTFVETGPDVDKLIYMTNDGCGKTCESACSTTCP